MIYLNGRIVTGGKCMENKKITVSYEDIKNYWITLFPEFDTMDELDCILKKISDVEPDNIYWKFAIEQLKEVV